MKASRKKQISQRRMIQQRLSKLRKLNEPAPPSGWLKAIRGSLGLSIRQLAERSGVAPNSINELEKRERLQRITLHSLDQAARAMECKLVYAIVPQNSTDTLEDIVRRRAIEFASEILRQASHTMKLEGQGTSEKQVRLETERLAQELIDSGDTRIWNAKIKAKQGID